MQMRLIDADKLKNIIEVSTRFSDFLGKVLNDDKTAEIYRVVHEGFVKQIDAEPTIEAIPVGWINKRLDDLNEYIDEHGENHMVLSKIQEAICLSRLLADWQEQRAEE